MNAPAPARARRRALVSATAWLLTAGLGGCGDGDAAAAIPFGARLEADLAEVEFGAAFALRVVCGHAAAAEPAAPAPAQLEPLVVELLGSDRRDAGDRAATTFRFRAHAFATGTLTVAPFEVRASMRGDSQEQRLATAPWTIAVRSALGATATPAPEGPGELLPIPGGAPWWPAALAVAVAIAAALAFGAHSRRADAPVAAVPAPAAPSPGAIALQELAALDATAARDRASELAFATAVATALRRCAGALAGCDGTRATTDELLMALAVRRGGASLAALAATLHAIDLVKFAAAAAPLPQRERWLAAARAFAAAADGGQP